VRVCVCGCVCVCVCVCVGCMGRVESGGVVYKMYVVRKCVISSFVYLYIFIFLYLYVYLYMCIFVCVYVYMCVYFYIFICVYVYMCTCVYTYCVGRGDRIVKCMFVICASFVRICVYMCVSCVSCVSCVYLLCGERPLGRVKLPSVAAEEFIELKKCDRELARSVCARRGLVAITYIYIYIERERIKRQYHIYIYI
jgi:hypothetical protein